MAQWIAGCAASLAAWGAPAWLSALAGCLGGELCSGGRLCGRGCSGSELLAHSLRSRLAV